MQPGTFRCCCRVLRALGAQPLKRGALRSKAALLRRKTRFGVTYRSPGSRCFGLRRGIALSRLKCCAFLQRGRAFQPLRAANILTAHGGTNAGEKAAF